MGERMSVMLAGFPPLKYVESLEFNEVVQIDTSSEDLHD